MDPYEPLYAENFDTIVSFNVLEHIEDDIAAVKGLSEILKKSQAPGPKRLVTFVPAHQWAYGGMDQTFQHFRRYSAYHIKEIAAQAAPDAQLEYRYFNLIGLVGWIVNGRLLGKKEIGLGAIDTFEAICPYVRDLDDWIHRFLGLPLGQSVLFTLTWC